MIVAERSWRPVKGRAWTIADVTVPPLPNAFYAGAYDGAHRAPGRRRSTPCLPRRAHLLRDATALLVLSEGEAFRGRRRRSPDTIAGYVARPPATVVTLTNGLVRAYSRMYPEGIDLGSARAGVPFAGSAPGLAHGRDRGESAVKEMPVDGTVPPQLATGFIALPDNSSVVGVRAASWCCP